jgi:hypothetical protein
MLMPDERLEAFEAVDLIRRKSPGPPRQMSLSDWAAELEQAAAGLRAAAGPGREIEEAVSAAAQAAALAVEILEALSG